MTITAVVTSNGWHLPVVQGIAWINMYGDYRESMSAEEAFEATVGGDYLCNVCKYVRTNNPSQEEEGRFLQRDKVNPLIAITTKQTTIRPRSRTTHQTDYRLALILRWEELDTPPPKIVLA